MTTAGKPKSFSMIREFHLADWFTLGNAISGMGALFSIMAYLQSSDVWYIYLGYSFLVVALIFDVVDGRVARWCQKTSLMGRELDSLADIISFGVTPAVIGYALGMNGLFDLVVLAYFVACGVSRLARYNVTAEVLSAGGDKVKYFEGTPIPTSLLIVGVLFFATYLGAFSRNIWFGEFTLAGFKFHPLVMMFALSGSLMISRIRIPKM